MRVSQIARVCHEANRALQIAQRDPAPSPHWEDAPESQTASAIDGVVQAIDGVEPKELHESWCDFKRASGWIFGEVKDEDAKTHPCLVAYDALPAHQQVKDHLFAAIVKALA